MITYISCSLILFHITGDVRRNLETQARPVITRVQVKKSLLRSLGNAKQCKLCDKVFSREKAAVAHVFESHEELLSPSDDNLERK